MVNTYSAFIIFYILPHNFFHRVPKIVQKELFFMAFNAFTAKTLFDIIGFYHRKIKKSGKEEWEKNKKNKADR